MKKSGPDRLLLVSVVLSIALWLMTGISKDDEFNEHSVFLKHRPSLQVYFTSPLGMDDVPPDFPPELAAKEAIYDEFVTQQHWSSKPAPVFIAGACLFAFPVLLIAGIIRTFRKA